MLNRPSPRQQPIILQPHGHAMPLSDNPWVLWQPVTQATLFTCTRCGVEAHGERYVELQGTEPQIFPVLPRSPEQIENMTSRIGRQVLCPTCRWAKPVTPVKPQRRKTQLD